ncbi:MAG: hypothetical protein ACK481_07385 [Candidatus Melainabacteria bacterium]|jgi:hypothetical protein
MSVNPVNFSLYAQPNSFVLCSNQGSFQVPSGEVRNVPTQTRTDNIEAAQRKFVQSTINPQTERAQTSFFDQALSFFGSVLKSQRPSNSEFVLI